MGLHPVFGPPAHVQVIGPGGQVYHRSGLAVDLLLEEEVAAQSLAGGGVHPALGILELARGLDTAIQAIQEVRQCLPHIRLIILGSGRDEDYLKSLSIKLNLTHHVQFLGWIDYEDAIAYISCADIGLVPHHATASWNTTIANKLFDYMSMGKPVIVSNAAPTERIVMDEQCGIVFKDRDPKSLAEAIIKLSDRNTQECQGKRGRDAVRRKYNWGVDENRLLTAIEATVNSGRSH